MSVDVAAEFLSFAVALRRAGVAADTGRVNSALSALAQLDPTDLEQVYWAGRLTVCAEPEDLPRYDQAFNAWFGHRRQPSGQRVNTSQITELLSPSASRRDDRPPGPDDPPREHELTAALASDVELLRHHDLAGLAAAERQEIERLIGLLTPGAGHRRTARMVAHRRHQGGRVDLSRTVRLMLADGGEPGRLLRQRPRLRPRRLVLLLDVSGSMSAYADALLRFAHAAVRVAPTTTEVFTLGTRLTRVTRPLRLRDAELALRAAAGTIPDWSGGTRLGEALQAFLDLWGQRGTARRALVVVFSDGWERGDPALLGAQMQRLSRLAHRVVWVHPHRDKDGFAPATGGMVAAAPYVDELVAGHSLAALTRVAQVIADA